MDTAIAVFGTAAALAVGTGSLMWFGTGAALRVLALPVSLDTLLPNNGIRYTHGLAPLDLRPALAGLTLLIVTVVSAWLTLRPQSRWPALRRRARFGRRRLGRRQRRPTGAPR